MLCAWGSVGVVVALVKLPFEIAFQPISFQRKDYRKEK